MMNEFEGLNIKLESKQYVRLDAAGIPELIRVDPYTTFDGRISLDRVAFYIDEGEAQVMDREYANYLLESTACVPLEITAQWKHRNKN
jgi:hypothetical protein